VSAPPAVDPGARAANRRELRHLGFGRVPDALDEAPPAGPTRDLIEVLDRALALHVIVAVAAGLDAEAGRRWLDGLGATGALTTDEADYLDDVADGIRVEDAARATAAEALAALLWCAGLADDLPLEGPAAWATTVLPGPGEGVADLLDAARLRDDAALLGAWDLAAGMVWALRADPDLEVGAAPGSLDPYVVRRRHSALRWVLGGEG
jgi:hypothetical protein